MGKKERFELKFRLSLDKKKRGVYAFEENHQNRYWTDEKMSIARRIELGSKVLDVAQMTEIFIKRREKRSGDNFKIGVSPT